MALSFQKILFALALGVALQAPVSAAAPFKMASAALAPANRDIIGEIISVVGLQARFEVMESAEVGNAAAVILGGKRYILYNPVFLAEVNSAVKTNWAGVSILAHEIGHHLNGHTLSSRGSNHADELEADEFSGFVLRRMGASLADAQAAMRLLAEDTPSHTHPERAKRLAHISKGWQQANEQLLAASAPANKKAPETAAVRARARAAQPVASARAASGPVVIDSRQVVGRVVFDKAPQNNFFITTRLNVVQQVNRRLKVVGKLSETDSERFPFVITSNLYSSLLISDSGIVVDQNGRRVGILQRA